MTTLTDRAAAAVRPPARRRRRLLVIAVAVLLGFAGLLFASTAIHIWWVARQDARPPSDAIIVLGAAQYQGRPSEWFEARLDHARALYDEGVAPRIITVGGNQPGDTFTEAESGRQWLIDHGVPRTAVTAVGVGGNTLDSLRAVDDVYDERGWRSAVLVTDPWHSLRSRTMARDLGMDAEASPTRQGPAVRERGTQITQILRETVALWTYRLTSSG